MSLHNDSNNERGIRPTSLADLGTVVDLGIRRDGLKGSGPQIAMAVEHHRAAAGNLAAWCWAPVSQIAAAF